MVLLFGNSGHSQRDFLHECEGYSLFGCICCHLCPDPPYAKNNDAFSSTTTNYQDVKYVSYY